LKLPWQKKDNVDNSTAVGNWKVAFGRSGEGIMSMDSVGGGLTTLVPGGHMVDASPDGSMIAYVNGMRLTPDPSGRAVTFGPKAPHIDPSYSITRLPTMYRVDGNWNLWLARSDGSQARQITKWRDAGCSWPKYSPDGKRILFKRTCNGMNELWVAPVAGGDPIRLIDGAQIGYYTWTNEGHVMLEAPTGDVVVINSSTGEPAQDNRFQDGDSEPVWHRSGQGIAFFNGDGLYVMDNAGQNRKRLTTLQGWVGAWSPDGQCLLFASRKNNANGADVYVIGRDGADERRLTSETVPSGGIGGDYEPCWVRI
jgi:dipeptidyl aminopeptidase/acylaminoacyl peptidase